MFSISKNGAGRVEQLFSPRASLVAGIRGHERRRPSKNPWQLFWAASSKNTLTQLCRT